MATKKPEPKLLGELMRRRRRARGLSQADIARALHWHRPSVSAIEGGRSLPPVHKVRKLAALLGVSVDRMLDACEATYEARGAS